MRSTTRAATFYPQTVRLLVTGVCATGGLQRLPPCRGPSGSGRSRRRGRAGPRSPGQGEKTLGGQLLNDFPRGLRSLGLRDFTQMLSRILFTHTNS